MASILDEYKEINIEKFEGAIAVGIKPAGILTMFNKTGKEMDDWCRKTYGNNFSTVYEMVRQVTYQEFLDIVKTLGYRGNPSALNIINQSINDHAGDNVVKIVFDNNVALETEDDKQDE